MLPYGGKPGAGFKGRHQNKRMEQSQPTPRAELPPLPSIKPRTPHPTASPHQHSLPEQKQHLLHGEVWSMATAEFGHHPEEHDREGLIVVQGGSWKHTAALARNSPSLASPQSAASPAPAPSSPSAPRSSPHPRQPPLPFQGLINSIISYLCIEKKRQPQYSIFFPGREHPAAAKAEWLPLLTPLCPTDGAETSPVLPVPLSNS